MKMQTKYFEAKVKSTEILPNGVKWQAVIFSSENNRNEYYFDIYKLLKWKSRLSSVLMNDNHNGKYYSPLTDKITDISVVTNNNGVTECIATIESTNEAKRANPELVTGFSIEISVDPKHEIKNQNGEYYLDFEWQGVAYLTGILAGSGGSRLLSMKTFKAQNELNNTNMDKQELLDILNEALTPIMESVETLKTQVNTLANTETVEDKTKENEMDDNSDDTKVTKEAESESEVDTTEAEKEAPVSTPAVKDETETDVETEAEKEAKAKEAKVKEMKAEIQKAVDLALKQFGLSQATDELTAIENSFNNVSKLKNFMAKAGNEELVTESQATENTATEPTIKEYNRTDAINKIKKLF